jgi:Spy/CpxP family protein refolding chaperone
MSPREKEKKTMHPAVASVWQRVFAGCGPYEGWSCGSGGRGGGGWAGSCGPGDDGGEAGGGGGGWDDGGGGGFGVRRPLRFLAYKLELDERQVAELARILNELKTERAQAEVDRRRTVAAFADAVAGDAFDAAKAGEGGALRVQSAERLRDAVAKALQQIHGVLAPEQRSRLAYLIRTGTLVI